MTIKSAEVPSADSTKKVIHGAHAKTSSSNKNRIFVFVDESLEREIIFKLLPIGIESLEIYNGPCARGRKVPQDDWINDEILMKIESKGERWAG